jgi:hypothetical protein
MPAWVSDCDTNESPHPLSPAPHALITPGVVLVARVVLIIRNHINTVAARAIGIMREDPKVAGYIEPPIGFFGETPCKTWLPELKDLGVDLRSARTCYHLSYTLFGGSLSLVCTSMCIVTSARALTRVRLLDAVAVAQEQVQEATEICTEYAYAVGRFIYNGGGHVTFFEESRAAVVQKCVWPLFAGDVSRAGLEEAIIGFARGHASQVDKAELTALVTCLEAAVAAEDISAAYDALLHAVRPFPVLLTVSIDCSAEYPANYLDNRLAGAEAGGAAEWAAESGDKGGERQPPAETGPGGRHVGGAAGCGGDAWGAAEYGDKGGERQPPAETGPGGRHVGGAAGCGGDAWGAAEYGVERGGGQKLGPGGRDVREAASSGGVSRSRTQGGHAYQEQGQLLCFQCVFREQGKLRWGEALASHAQQAGQVQFSRGKEDLCQGEEPWTEAVQYESQAVRRVLRCVLQRAVPQLS